MWNASPGGSHERKSWQLCGQLTCRSGSIYTESKCIWAQLQLPCRKKGMQFMYVYMLYMCLCMWVCAHYNSLCIHVHAISLCVCTRILYFSLCVHKRVVCVPCVKYDTYQQLGKHGVSLLITEFIKPEQHFLQTQYTDTLTQNYMWIAFGINMNTSMNYE